MGPKPTVGRWKKWRRDLEGFIDTIGLSWKGTSGLLRELRHRETLFNSSQLEEVIEKAKARGDKHPAIFGFDYDEKKDVVYWLLIPKLDEVLSNELAQNGGEDDW